MKHQAQWDWANELPAILLASLLISPYSWTYDLVMIIPVIILVAYWISKDLKHWRSILLIMIFVGITILDIFLHQKVDEFWFIWLTPVLVIMFLIARWQYSAMSNNAKLIDQSIG